MAFYSLPHRRLRSVDVIFSAKCVITSTTLAWATLDTVVTSHANATFIPQYQPFPLILHKNTCKLPHRSCEMRCRMEEFIEILKKNPLFAVGLVVFMIACLIFMASLMLPPN
jgi:hypothetical protein